MNAVTRFLLKLRFRILALFGGSRKNEDLNQELEQHLELAIEYNLSKGLSPEIARREALKEFGNVEALKEDCRDSWGIRVVTDLIRDVHYSAHSLWKSKGFSLAVIATLAICIGANATIMSALYDLVLRPLPFPNSDRLVQIFTPRPSDDERPTGGGSWVGYKAYNEKADLFEGFSLVYAEREMLYGSLQLRGMGVTSDFLDMLDVRPLLGRFFTPDEIYPGPGDVLVLTQTAWENLFSADPGVIGRQMRFHNSSYTVVGVVPRSIESLDRNIRFLVPHRIRNPHEFGGSYMDTWARLKPGVSRDAAAKQIGSIYRATAQDMGWDSSVEKYDKDPNIRLERVNPLKQPLILIQGAGILVLLIGCFNVVNLLLSRLDQKRHELVVRHSLGSGFFGLARLMICESLLLVVVGTGMGLLLAMVCLQVINGYTDVLLPNAQPITLSSVILGWNLAIAVGTSLVMGLFPLVLLWKSGLIQKVKSSDRTTSAGRGVRMTSTILVVSQVAFTFALLIGAGLLSRSFKNVLDVEPGFDLSRIVRAHVGVFIYDKADQLSVRHRIVDSMREISGVEKASVKLDDHPVTQYQNIGGFEVPGLYFEEFENGLPVAARMYVGSDFFETFKIPILEGRSFKSGDTETSFIVDELFVERYMGDRQVVGSPIKFDWPLGPGESMPRIVGVAARANYQGLEKYKYAPVVYICSDGERESEFTIFLRTSRPADSIINEMRVKLREIDPRLALRNASSAAFDLSNLHLERKLMTEMINVFAGIALLVSVVGIYSVLAYDVQKRTREIGIRTAIGATRNLVLKMILRQGLRKAIVGLAIGGLASLYLSRFLESKLFEVAAMDIWTYTSVVLIFLLVALSASYLPARRAMRVDPMESLRAE